MPGNVPYDENLMASRQRAQMGPQPLHTPGPTIVERQGFEHHARFIERNAGRFATWAARVGTHEGRVAMAEDRVARLTARQAAVRRAGDIHNDPRLGGTNPAQKVGWPGINKFNATGATRREEDYTNAGFQLLDSKRIADSPVRGAGRTDIVKDRPATHSETRATARMSNKSEKAYRTLMEARWPSDHYGDLLDASVPHKVSPTEQSHFGAVSRGVEGRVVRARRTLESRERIADSRDLGGRWASFRLARAQRKVAKG